MTLQYEDNSKEITVTVRKDDALALVLGGLDYAVAVMEGKISKDVDASPMRLRQALARALQDAGVWDFTEGANA